ncbi:hypothetical protein D3C84_860810 [compost metagenome]
MDGAELIQGVVGEIGFYPILLNRFRAPQMVVGRRVLIAKHIGADKSSPGQRIAVLVSPRFTPLSQCFSLELAGETVLKVRLTALFVAAGQRPQPGIIGIIGQYSRVGCWQRFRPQRLTSNNLAAKIGFIAIPNTLTTWSAFDRRTFRAGLVQQTGLSSAHFALGQTSETVEDLLTQNVCAHFNFDGQLHVAVGRVLGFHSGSVG